MRGLEFLTGHVTFKLHYNQIQELKTPLMSESIFTLVSSPKNLPNHYPQLFQAQLNLVWKVEISNLAPFLGDGTKVKKLPSEIKPTLSKNFDRKYATVYISSNLSKFLIYDKQKRLSQNYQPVGNKSPIFHGSGTKIWYCNHIL